MNKQPEYIQYEDIEVVIPWKITRRIPLIRLTGKRPIKLTTYALLTYVATTGNRDISLYYTT